MLYFCAFCNKSCDYEVPTPKGGIDIAVTICKECADSLRKQGITIFFDGREIVLETLDPTPLDDIEFEDDNDGEETVGQRFNG